MNAQVKTHQTIEGAAGAEKEIALVGNPNCGKTTIFNALTGLRHVTANYPGVTVEKKTGMMKLNRQDRQAVVIDLPGTYSLLPHSPDEDVVHDVLIGLQAGSRAPDLIVLIIDAMALERNLFLALQVLETGIPVVLALNMWDAVEQNGYSIDADRLSAILGVRCVKTVGNRRKGIAELRRAIESELDLPSVGRFRTCFDAKIEAEIESIRRVIEPFFHDADISRGEAIRILSDSACRNPLLSRNGHSALINQAISQSRTKLEEQGIDWTSFEPVRRYEQIERICGQVVRKISNAKTLTERLDQILTHPILGFLVFFSLITLVFQAIFTWAETPKAWIDAAFRFLEKLISSHLPEGALRSLLTDGVLAGVGNVVSFLPQIFFLFFFIAMFEDSGYMARAAFVLDRLMKKVGLNGRSFLPLLSSFACAVPGILSTRTIQDRNDRLATILVAPLMSCSARLPVYTLLIGAFIPATQVLGFVSLKGLTLFVMYVLGLLVGLVAAYLFRKTLLRGRRAPFVFELPPYRVPHWRTVLTVTWERGKEFLYRAGGVIFAAAIVLWFLASYPKSASLDQAYEAKRIQVQAALSGQVLQDRLKELHAHGAAEAVASSYAGRIGRAIEPFIRPLGFDWKIGVGLVSSLAAREVIVSTLAIVHDVGTDEDSPANLAEALRSEVSSETGLPVYTPLVALSLMIFFVFACQCLSTVAVVRREMGSWLWPGFMIAYMTVLAWGASFIVFQGGKALGFR